MNAPLTPAQIRDLPAVVDLPTAGRALGIGRTTAYELARTGQFPCRILRIGRSYRVPVAGLAEVLGIAAPQTTGSTEPKEEPARDHQPRDDIQAMRLRRR